MVKAIMKGNIDQYNNNSSMITDDVQEAIKQLEKEPPNSGKPHILLIEGAPGIGTSQCC